MSKDEQKNMLCEVSALEEHWNVTASPKNNNVYSRYMRNPKKQKQVKIMDMGVFCLINDITPDMLKMGVRHIKEVAALFQNEELKSNNKVVVMSEDDFRAYEEYKKFKAFSQKSG